MNRKEAAELLPFIKAFGEGKDIEIRSKNTHAQLNGWAKMDEFIFGNFEYRIKPEPKYRPFENAKECWAEMLKHQPFGWVVDTRDGVMHLIRCLEYASVYTSIQYSFKYAFDKFAFADLVPFGVKVEE